ncbi:hypothetical protein OK016_29140 [Vibrio chagasii]|nr:hypothetical protein [Vibrio chagasii]
MNQVHQLTVLIAQRLSNLIPSAFAHALNDFGIHNITVSSNQERRRSATRAEAWHQDSISRCVEL